MRLFLYFLLSVALLSCDKESVVEREVNAEYKNLQRKWQFTSIETKGANSDSVLIDLLAASVDWSVKCKYNDEGGNFNLCGGKGNFNSLETTYAYGYDAADDQYILQIGYASKNAQEQKLGRKLDDIINGRWEFEINDKTLIAKQISNERLPGVLTTLTAKAL